jgi:glycerol uptake facilitator-like aquaporin
MKLLSEFVGSLIFLLGGYSYMANVTLKKHTLVSALNYIELVVAWSLAVGFGLATAVIMGGPALLNPGVAIGKMILGVMGSEGGLSIQDGLLYIVMEFLAAGAAEIIVLVFFYDGFKDDKESSKHGIFAANAVNKNYLLNAVQEILATFLFLFLVFTCIKATSGDSAALQIGVIGFCSVALLSLTLNSTGFSMNAMRSFFSSVWFAILPIPNKNSKIDWAYQVGVNLVASSIGGVLAVLATSLF